MTPVRKPALLLLALLLLPGCAGDEAVGRVGATEVHLSGIEVLYESNAISIGDFRQALFRLMAVEVIRQGLAADFQATVEPARVDDYLADLEAYLAQYGYTPAQYLGVENASEAMLRFNAEVMALRDTVLDLLIVSPDTVEELFADPVGLTEVCVKHIVVTTEDEAEAAKARLAAGEDFATVAEGVSQDTANEGGDLGCAPAASYGAPFAAAAVAAPLGEVTGPVLTDWGYRLLVVTERTTPTREEYLADPREQLTDDQLADLWSDWYNDRLRAADAWVAERYGTWTPVGITGP